MSSKVSHKYHDVVKYLTEEKVLIQQLSSYFHSTEIVLVKVANDTLLASDDVLIIFLFQKQVNISSVCHLMTKKKKNQLSF